MNAAQATAFEEGTGGSFTAAELLLTVQLLGATAVFLYVAWLCYRAYEDYGSEVIKAKDMIVVWFRSFFILMLLLAIFTNT